MLSTHMSRRRTVLKRNYNTDQTTVAIRPEAIVLFTGRLLPPGLCKSCLTCNYGVTTLPRLIATCLLLLLLPTQLATACCVQHFIISIILIMISYLGQQRLEPQLHPHLEPMRAFRFLLPPLFRDF